jgi:hypothetical protein
VSSPNFFNTAPCQFVRANGACLTDWRHPEEAAASGCGQQKHPGCRNWQNTRTAVTRVVKGLIWADGVSNRGADSEHIVGVERAVILGVVVILDVVVLNLGTDKGVVPDVIAETGADVLHEVIAAGVVDAGTSEGATGDDGRDVEAGAGDSDAAEKIETNFFAQPGLEERVEVGQDRAVVYVFAGEGALTGSPGGFNLKAEAALVADYVTADVKVGAAPFRWRKERTAGGGGSQQGAAADKNVTLLGRGKLGEEQASEHGCEES